MGSSLEPISRKVHHEFVKINCFGKRPAGGHMGFLLALVAFQLTFAGL